MEWQRCIHVGDLLFNSRRFFLQFLNLCRLGSGSCLSLLQLLLQLLNPLRSDCGSALPQREFLVDFLFVESLLLNLLPDLSGTGRCNFVK